MAAPGEKRLILYETSVSKTQNLLLTSLLEKNPSALSLKVHHNFTEAKEATLSNGCSMEFPKSSRITISLLPDTMLGVTGLFQLSDSFSDFKFRCQTDIQKGISMQKLAQRLGEGPTFVIGSDKTTDVLHMDVLPHRMGKDSAPWAPYLGKGHIAIVTTSALSANKEDEQNFLLVDIPQLPNAKRAYQNVFGANISCAKVEALANHALTKTLQDVAIRNAQRVAALFAEVSNLEFKSTTIDHCSLDPNASIPVLSALSVDPVIAREPSSNLNKIPTYTIGSGLRRHGINHTVPGVYVASPQFVCVSFNQKNKSFMLPAQAAVLPEKQYHAEKSESYKFIQDRVFWASCAQKTPSMLHEKCHRTYNLSAYSKAVKREMADTKIHELRVESLFLHS